MMIAKLNPKKTLMYAVEKPNTALPLYRDLRRANGLGEFCMIKWTDPPYGKMLDIISARGEYGYAPKA